LIIYVMQQMKLLNISEILENGQDQISNNNTISLIKSNYSRYLS